MAKPKVGSILDPNKEYKRDAIHVPILSVIAYEKLQPGEKVAITKNEDNVLEAYSVKNRCFVNGFFVGIVDPFLEDSVKFGEKFYLFLKPESTLKLWHDWIHPLVDGKKKENKVL